MLASFTNQKRIGGSKLKSIPTLIISVIFIFYYIIPYLFFSSKDTSSTISEKSVYDKQSKIVKFFNSDASLSVPFLDRINEFWHIGGNTHIRNSEFIRLVKSGIRNTNGIVISNGIGDNIIDDFEMNIRIKISNPKLPKPQEENSNNVSGFAIMISPENNFVTSNLRSSYAKEQYKINSNGILGDNTELMGVPRNLPGLALVYQNDLTINDEKFDIILNANPNFHWKTQGEIPSIYLGGKKFNDIDFYNNNHWDNKNELFLNIRIAYFETIGFLRIDVQNPEDSNDWYQITKQDGNIYLPKNSKNDQRYISISGLNNDATSNIDILNVKTEEFHWLYENNVMDLRDKDYINEVKKFLIERYDYKPAPGSVNFDETTESSTKKHGTRIHPKQRNWFISLIFNILKLLLFISLLIIFYFTTLYFRVSIRHWKLVHNRRGKRSVSGGILPS